MSEDEMERAIAVYREQLSAEAELADRDLDEIEDHLRSLADDLRESGMPAATALTEAAHRLGKPRELAREHARVRSVFGAHLSRTRVWSAVALILPMFVLGSISRFEYTELWRFALDTGISAAFVLGLVFGKPWARTALLGSYAVGFMMTLSALIYAASVTPELFSQGSLLVWYLAALAVNVGVFAFLVPWRRAELTRAGMTVVLTSWSSGVAALFFPLGWDLPTGVEAPSAFVTIGLAANVLGFVAMCGAILRAPWTATACVLGAFALSGLYFVVPDAVEPFGPFAFIITSGCVASLVGAALARRALAARSVHAPLTKAWRTTQLPAMPASQRTAARCR